MCLVHDQKNHLTLAGKDLSTLQAAIMASESKVADWLAQNDPPLVRRESTEEDGKSIKSDVPVQLKRLKGTPLHIHLFILQVLLWKQLIKWG